jgi:hypothetical protein
MRIGISLGVSERIGLVRKLGRARQLDGGRAAIGHGRLERMRRVADVGNEFGVAINQYGGLPPYFLAALTAATAARKASK